MTMYKNKQGKIGIDVHTDEKVISILTLNGELLTEKFEDLIEVSVHDDLAISLGKLKNTYLNEHKKEYHKELSNILKAVL